MKVQGITIQDADGNTEFVNAFVESVNLRDGTKATYATIPAREGVFKLDESENVFKRE